jgi:hypothetical protein
LKLYIQGELFMKKTILLPAVLFVAAALFFAGCELKETDVGVADNSGGGGSEEGGNEPSAIVKIYAQSLIGSAGGDAVSVNGDIITIQKSFTLNENIPINLPAGAVLNIGGSESAAQADEAETVTITLAKGVNFEVGEGTLVLNGQMKLTDGAFGLGNGTVQLYGVLDVGNGRLAYSEKDKGKLNIYPGATLQDMYDNSARQLVGANSFILGSASVLELTGEFTNTHRTRQFALTGNATLAGTQHIFNNGGAWTETVTLKDGASFTIDNTLLYIGGTESTLETLNTYIKGSNGGTITCINGGSLVCSDGDETVIISSGSYSALDSTGWTELDFIPTEE